MKCTIPEISWHNRDPVLSVDVQPTRSGTACPYRLATGGTDSHVVIWYITVKDCGLAAVEVAADLQRHQRAVNTVRFAPSGQYLASGDDESVIIIWKPKTEHDISELTNTDGEVSKEQWVSMKTLRGHLEDVYDLCWSLDSTHLVSGSIDNTAIVWDVQKGRNLGILSGHGGFVQGVAWDPKNKYVATLSSDRTCRIHNISTKKLTAKISKTTLPVPSGTELDGKIMRLFHDDTLKSFFRRLSFSPDGELLVAPSGVIELPNTEKHINATFIFVRYDFSRPVVYLPSPHEYTVAVRFCPLLFKLHEGNSLFTLPYRMVFAVATKSNVILYDTQQPEPIAFISNIHYTRLTDLSWSSDGRVLITSSTDGYCSIITFSERELGDVYEHPSANIESENEFQSSENKVTNSNQQESSKSEREHSNDLKSDADLIGKIPVRDIPKKQSPSVPPGTKSSIVHSQSTGPESKSRRRIPLITLSSPRKNINIPEPVLKESSTLPLQSQSTSSLPSPMSSTRLNFEDKGEETENSEKVGRSISNESVGVSNISPDITRTSVEEIENIENSIVSMQTEGTIDANSNHEDQLIITEVNKSGIVNESVESTPFPRKTVGEDTSGQCSEEPMEVDVNSGPEACVGTEKQTEDQIRQMSDPCAIISTVEATTSHNIPTPEEKPEERKTQDSCSRKITIAEKDLKVEEPLSPRKEATNENSNPDSIENSPVRVHATKFLCETTPSKSLSHEVMQSGESNQRGTPNSIKASAEVSQPPEVQCNTTPVANRTPRRVKFITISSPKSKKK